MTDTRKRRKNQPSSFFLGGAAETKMSHAWFCHTAFARCHTVFVTLARREAIAWPLFHAWAPTVMSLWVHVGLSWRLMGQLDCKAGLLMQLETHGGGSQSQGRASQEWLLWTRTQRPLHLPAHPRCHSPTIIVPAAPWMAAADAQDCPAWVGDKSLTPWPDAAMMHYR